DIYTGKVTNWAKLGGQNAKITVINRPQGRSELELVTEYWQIQPDEMKAELVTGETQHTIKSVAQDPNAIAYLSVGSAEYDAILVTSVRLLPLEGSSASTRMLASGVHPVRLPLLLVYQPPLSLLAQTFLDYVLSEEVHVLSKEYAFVPP